MAGETGVDVELVASRLAQRFLGRRKFAADDLALVLFTRRARSLQHVKTKQKSRAGNVVVDGLRAGVESDDSWSNLFRSVEDQHSSSLVHDDLDCSAGSQRARVCFRCGACESA